MSTRHLLIDATWNGQRLEESEQVGLRISSSENGGGLRVRVDAPFYDDPPPPGPPGPTPGLWNFEVVELFISQASGDEETVRYVEIEWSPHGHYLVLRFRGVRQLVEQGVGIEFRTTIDRKMGRWSGEARLPFGLLPPCPHRINAFAIHGNGDHRRFLVAAPLPSSDLPDFHRPLQFPLADLPIRPQHG